MSYLSWILIGIASKITRRLFIRETKKLSKKLGIPLWKVQALIIGGIIVCIGGIWYIKTNATKEGFKKGFNEGVKTGFRTGFESGTKDPETVRRNINEGAWRAIKDITSRNIDSEYYRYFEESGFYIKEKFDSYDSFSRSYEKTYWGFGGEWD